MDPDKTNTTDDETISSSSDIDTESSYKKDKFERKITIMGSHFH